jgi:DNA polymerase III alpha subunit
MTAYAELVAATNFSFLTGASQPWEMVEMAMLLGYKGPTGTALPVLCGRGGT